MKNPKSLKEIITDHKIFGGLNISNLMILNSVWKNEMKEYSLYCDIFSIEKKTLVLKIKNPVVKNEIYIKKDIILRKINKYFNSNFIKDIKFV
jgi:hypothetical protein